MNDVTGRPVSVRRARTRDRLLDAALDVFAEEGFGRSTVEQVCERAGFSRGAFYSNFDSLDQLFLAMWERQSSRLLGGIAAAIAEASPPPGSRDLERSARRILGVIPVEDRWYRVSAEFTAHALRNPSLRAVVAARESAILAALMPIVETELAAAGRRVTDPVALGRALVAVHDGTSVQILLEPDDEQIVSARTQLFVCVLRSYSESV